MECFQFKYNYFYEKIDIWSLKSILNNPKWLSYPIPNLLIFVFYLNIFIPLFRPPPAQGPPGPPGPPAPPGPPQGGYAYNYPPQPNPQ